MTNACHSLPGLSQVQSTTLLSVFCSTPGPLPVAALLLVPTRELALQTSQVCKELGKHMGVQVICLGRLVHCLQMPVAGQGRCPRIVQLAACMQGLCSTLR